MLSVYSKRNWVQCNFFDWAKLFGYVFNVQFLYIGSSSFLNRFPDILIDLIYEIIFRFDALNNPFIHFVDKGMVVASLLQQSLNYLISNVLFLLRNV